MLGLQLSDLDKILYRHTLGVEEGSCASPMSVIIMGAEICWSTCFATWCEALSSRVGVEAALKGESGGVTSIVVEKSRFVDFLMSTESEQK